ncbi:hypothetical protein DMUE_5949 [Dictyocoela muelleri]|nr:hypothetical protein DMUE_5949 [Dictyocoela muelleri]
MRPFKNLTKIGAPDLGTYLRTESFAFEVLIRLNVIPKEKHCPFCKEKMKVYGKHKGYFYCKRKCKIKLSRRYGTILENTKITFKKFIILCHYYFNKTLITKNLLRDVKISRSLITKFKYKIEHKIKLFNQKQNLKMGGIGSIVEVDESLMASAKYGKEKYPEHTWVFGIVEREAGRCYIKVVDDRNKANLEKNNF